MHATHKPSRFHAFLRSGVALLLVAGASLPAVADDARIVDRRVVSYADLDLDSRSGLAAMYARLEHAAEQVCGGEPAPIELVRRQRFESCVDASLAEAVGQSRSAALASVHATRRATTG